MSIEKDINQTAFNNEYQKLMINIIFTANWIQEKMKPYFDKEDITGQQFNILRILRGAGKPISTMQIRQRMLDKMSDTSRIVDRLVKKELVIKTACPNDKRLVDVSITKKGNQLLQKLDTSVNDMKKICSSITEQQACTISEYLDKIRETDM